MDDYTRRNMIDVSDSKTAELIGDMARRQSRPPLEPRMGPDMARRISDLERSRRGSKVLDMTGHIGRRNVA